MKIANPNRALFLEQITPKLPSIFHGSSPRKKKNGSTKPLMLMSFLTPRGYILFYPLQQAKDNCNRRRPLKHFRLAGHCGFNLHLEDVRF